MDACAITHDELDLRVRFPDRGGVSQIPTADLKRFGPIQQTCFGRNAAEGSAAQRRRCGCSPAMHPINPCSRID